MFYPEQKGRRKKFPYITLSVETLLSQRYKDIPLNQMMNCWHGFLPYGAFALALHFPVSFLSFQEKAKLVIQPHNPSFSASRGQVDKFFTRHKLVRKQLGVLIKFCADAPRFTRIGKYHFSVVGHMDETLAFFNIVPSNCFAKKGERECVVRSSGSEKKHLTVVLPATTDGQMLPLMIIIRGKLTTLSVI